MAFQRKHPHANRTLHGIRMFYKNSFIHGRNRNKLPPFRFAEVFAERFLTKHIFYPPYTIIAHLSGNVNRAVPGMIMPVVKLFEYSRIYPAIILFLHQSSARMHLTIYSFHQRPMRQKIHFGRVDHELLDIIFYYNTQLLLRKYRLFYDGLQYFQRLWQIFVQRIKSNIRIFRCAGQLQPGTVIVQLLRYFPRTVPKRPFAQHTVRKQSL